MPDEEREARMALAAVAEAGDPRIGPLVEQFGAAAVWQGLLTTKADTPWARRARALDLRPARLLARRHGLRYVIPGDPEWPAGLGDLATCDPVQDMAGPPLGLWVAGGLELGSAVGGSVAMVGSRASSAYGDRMAGDLAAGLAEERVTVLSGGAYGLDAAAHRGALAGDGVTVAVLAGGIDEPYPRSHAGLLARVAATGLLVSEHHPGEHPTRRRFLARNRLIAALSAATVIVEGALRSGARNTVSWASACHRPVLAVPGPASSATSLTPHRLIREGEAVLATSVAHILEAIRPVGAGLEEQRPRTDRLLDGLDREALAVVEALPSRGGRDAGEVSLRAGLTVPATLSALGRLAESGLARRREDGLWRRGDVHDRPLLAHEALPADRATGEESGQCSNSAASSSV